MTRQVTVNVVVDGGWGGFECDNYLVDHVLILRTNRPTVSSVTHTHQRLIINVSGDKKKKKKISIDQFAIVFILESIKFI